MPLTTFVPTVGPHAASSYTLPYFAARPQFSLAYGSDISNPEELSGDHVGAGMGTAFPGGGTLSGTFKFTANWCALNGYGTGTFGDVMSAIADFSRYVLMGGMGTLTDVPPSGMKIGGVLVTSRICTARMYGTPQLTIDGDPSSALDVTIHNPSGLWTCQMASGNPVVTQWPS